MTDKELLESAAKALGAVYYYGGLRGINGRCQERWNPLADDGDALRLAEALDMEVNFTCAYVRCANVEVISAIQSAEEFDRIWEPTMRRAIVRAAAEVGRASL